MNRSRIVRRSVGIFAAVSMFAACGSGEASTDAPDPARATTTTADPRPKAVLTGLPLDDASVQNRPVLTVKIDNHPQARPQFGIDQADVIVEEKVEGGLSRFMALFQSNDVDRVGPVRSLRSTDAKWLKPEGGMIAYSGGIPAFKNLLAPNGITDLGADSHGPTYYKRRADRPFEHSQFTNTNTLRTLTPKGETGPKALFGFTSPGETFGGTTAVATAGMSTRMGTGVESTFFDWTWDPQKRAFVRGTEGKAHDVEGQGQIAMNNVIVQFTTYSATAFRDRANAPVDEANVVGSGDAWVLSDGKIVRGRWTRASSDQITQYTDSAGAPVEMQPGRTWISLVPPGQPTEVR